MGVLFTDYPEGKLPPSYDVALERVTVSDKIGAVADHSASKKWMASAHPGVHGRAGLWRTVQKEKGYDHLSRNFGLSLEALVMQTRSRWISFRSGLRNCLLPSLYSPSTLLGIHRHLFTDVSRKKFRKLDGEYHKRKSLCSMGRLVQYSSHFMIQDTLYDFEKNRISRTNLTHEQSAVCDGISQTFGKSILSGKEIPAQSLFSESNIWEIRFHIDNSLFSEHAAYFRNALVLSTIIMARNRINSSENVSKSAVGQKEYAVRWRNVHEKIGQNVQRIQKRRMNSTRMLLPSLFSWSKRIPLWLSGFRVSPLRFGTFDRMPRRLSDNVYESDSHLRVRWLSDNTDESDSLRKFGLKCCQITSINVDNRCTFGSMVVR